jgi:hypothetical protein
MNFITTFLFFGFVFIPFMLFFIIGGADKQHKIGGAIVGLVFWFLCSGGLYLQSANNAEQWNDGACECGTQWELSAVSESRNGYKTKYYTCENCHTEIVIKC